MKIQDYGPCPSDDSLQEYIDDFLSSFKKWNRRKLISKKIDYVVSFSDKAFFFLFNAKDSLSKKDRNLVEKSLAYFCWPNDLILDSLGPIGFTDDTFLLCFVIFSLNKKFNRKNSINLESCQKILDEAPSYLGEGIKKRLKEHVFHWSK
tara:strand:+ start:1285 stop:1731 length:447 start_codon:yes stop_codon:yes gene_type:complete